MEVWGSSGSFGRVWRSFGRALGGLGQLWEALTEMGEARGVHWEALYIEKVPINRPSGRYVMIIPIPRGHWDDLREFV